MRLHPQEDGFRMLAKAVLGAFLFLLAASFWALPCLTAAVAPSDLFSSPAAPQSCQEHKIFKAQADVSHLGGFLPAGTVFRFLAVLPVVAIAAAFILQERADSARRRKRRSPRAGTLPFVRSDPPKLAAFAALRDA